MLSTSDVQKIATLSGLVLTDDQLTHYQSQFEEILQYVKQLDDVDVTGLEPTYQVTGLANVTRTDEVIDYGVSQAELLKNAPDQQDGSIKVRRVL
ncbi:MAG: Asp-tRNA(Asn)/Glu-tRNA(Gln) amidotransferase subunit GatC [Microcoleus sp.]